MANMKEVWGFDQVIAAGIDNGADLPNLVMKKINAAARDFGVNPGRPSDQLDMSRDLIIDDALGSAPWAIENGILCVAFDGAPLDMVIAAAAE